MRALFIGASEGIGGAFARRLAAKGYEVTAVAENEPGLKELIQELSGGSRSYRMIDLSTRAGLDRVASELTPHQNHYDLLAHSYRMIDLSTRAGLDRVASELTPHQNHYDLLVSNAAVGIHRRFDETPRMTLQEMTGLDRKVAHSHSLTPYSRNERGHEKGQRRNTEEGVSAMKCLTFLFVLFVLLGITQTAWAGPEEEISQVAQQAFRAMEEGNLEAFMAGIAENAVVTPPRDPFRIEGKEAIRAFFAGFFQAFPTRRLAVRQPSARVFGASAVMNAYLHTTLVDRSGQVKTLDSRASVTMVKLGDRWVLVDLHQSLLPASP